jgi:hypothetical protein
VSIVDRGTRLRLPALGVRQVAYLWWSYQRYAALLICAPIAVIAIAVAAAPWWAAAIAVVAGLAPVRFGLEVAGRWPRKLRATRIGLARLHAGTFTPRTIRGYCGDPCYRVVARELLARAGVPRAERRAIIARFADELRRERSLVFVFDHVRGTVVTLGGDAPRKG